MREYAIYKGFEITETIKTDVVIIGAGVAGLYAALNMDSKLNVIILSKLGLEESNSIYAQGGIASIRLATDTWESHINDTLRAGAGMCDIEAVTVLVKEGPDNIENLVRLGVPFDRDENNNLSITKEAAHSCDRIVHCGGDATGYHLTKTLIANCRNKHNVKIIENMHMLDILTENGAAVGVVVKGENRNYIIEAAHVIIASGGIGRVFRNSTNSVCSTGDGIAAAMRAGAVVKDMEFVQFHPTALIYPNDNMRFFLISEAMRGSGAVLRNRKGERFMQKAHEMAELAPRDIVSRSIVKEMTENDLPCVYLDITFKPRNVLKERFPQIYENCLKRDIDIAVNWIPVFPVQHYFMGGIKTDTNGLTNIENLYACGESSCTGVHGANRLASNSLLECLVFSKRCANHINSKKHIKPTAIALDLPEKAAKQLDCQTYRSRIRDLMTKKGGIVRKEKHMTDAKAEISGYLEELKGTTLNSYKEFETLNMATVANKILTDALQRLESVGAHYRED
ncbi:MAG: L-aspartate oxidase [Clostridia bacterium]|nr:L-aspartate oxidase [Clostridia bacterium]